MTDPKPEPHATGGGPHPITGDLLHAWQFAPDAWAWMNPDGSVCIDAVGPQGSSVIPRSHLAVLARGLLAAHVHAARGGT